jgi:flavin-dependent dehydrogenase
MTSYDIAVIGAGPAGSAAAITAAGAGQRVLLVDKDEFPRHKVCGEFVSFESTRLLESLLPGVDSFPRIPRVRLFRGDAVYEGALRAAALSISRYDLDAMLVEAARNAGAEVRTRCRVKAVAPQGEGFALESDSDEFRARHVVNAAGRWSELREDRSLPAERWIGIRQHFTEAEPPFSTDLYFFPGGYCGVQPIATDRVNVSALVKAGAARTMDEVIVRSRPLTQRSHGWTPVTEPITTAPIVFGPPQPVSRGMANVGDAAAFIDPFLGDGIAIALQTGALATRCLIDGGVERYRGEYMRWVAPAIRRAALLRKLSRSRLAWKAMKVPGMVGMTARATRVRIGVST